MTAVRAQATHPDRGIDWRATVRGEHDVLGFVTRTCFKTGPPRRVGIESEWLLQDREHPDRSVGAADLDTLAGTVGRLPGGSRLTFEPGGQLELSTVCADSLTPAVSSLRADLAHLDVRLTGLRWRRAGLGADPYRPPRRLSRDRRYVAMESYFDADGPYGRAMMCSTASVQVCLDAGADRADQRRRWALLNALAPVLTAVFANSPVLCGRRIGWVSSRQHIWMRLDARRTSAPAGEDPAEAWAGYALAAPVMLVRRDGGPWWHRPGMTFGEWVDGKGPAGLPAPTFDDLAYHLSTLFPPVRPHGWLELRSIDALPDAHWPVAVAVTTALVEDPRAGDAALAAVADLPPGAARHAARRGVADPALRRAALGCLAAALEALPRVGATHPLRAAAGRYVDRYPAAGRMPADDQLDQLRMRESR